MTIRNLMASSALAALMAAGSIGYAGAQTSPAEQPATEATSPAMPADAATTEIRRCGRDRQDQRRP